MRRVLASNASSKSRRALSNGSPPAILSPRLATAIAAMAITEMVIAARAIAAMAIANIPLVRADPTTQGGAALDPRELNGQAPDRLEQASHRANGYELARIPSAGNGVVLAVAGEIDLANA